MGFEDRDYSRDDDIAQRWGHEYPTTRNLLVATVVVFFFQTILTQPGGRDGFGLRVSLVDKWFMLDTAATVGGQVWRLLTYTFCHYRHSAFELVFNMLGLWFFGRRLEQMYGSREFLFFYLGSALAAGAVFTAFGLSEPMPMPLGSATPAILALFCLYACHFPREQILFCWVIPIEIWVLLVIYAALDTYAVLQLSQGEVPLLAGAFAASHLTGIAFGYFYKHLDWHLSGLFGFVDPTRWRRAIRQRSVGRKLRVYNPSDDDQLDGAVDKILVKIHEQGSDSLTAAERATLTRASERAKNKPKP